MAKHASGQTPGDPGPREPAGEEEDQVVDQRASTAPEAPARPSSELAAELEAARDEAQATFARYQRPAADSENCKRGTPQDLAERTQYANEALARTPLPRLDNAPR